jgi:hypothetical protein
MTNIGEATLVVAHPDDEILWFSSILQHCKSVMVCFGPSATSAESWDPGRSVLMNSYPLGKVRFLKLRQSDAFESADWSRAKETGSGLQLRRTSPLYENNAARLMRMLEMELPGETVVITHNPWGEYGNEEHVQVYRVLSILRERLGFELLVNSYVSNRSMNLMSRYRYSLAADTVMRETDRALAHRLKDRYLANDCWTWMPDYEWPEYESLYRVTRDGRQPGTTASPPLNYLHHDFHQSPIRKLASRAVPAPLRTFIKSTLRPGDVTSRGFDVRANIQ